ncbi:extradiol ring-cleavage dioxygenase [Aulographum hederae CBS 113979]|uniref:Extradiol ring-cleavage dioxygenase n=1 Tax=Aulographum hederae CBS 113979 TaxID=1176131 RepID=A0A6G1GZD7_9PEZI|nr:extradiol ring-cleavage dioxygenase [Aulographum hederae CBS 113979]
MLAPRRLWLTSTRLFSLQLSARSLCRAEPFQEQQQQQLSFFDENYNNPSLPNPISYSSNFSSTANMTRRAPVISISHGGGPMPLLGDPSHAAIVESLKTRVPEALKLGTDEAPRAIVLVTAHWSTDEPTISAAEKNELLYDYHGFPSEAYKLKYPAKGSKEVAELVRESLAAEGMSGQLDVSRGWDHGVFIPMLLINPSANVPIIQVSVLASESISAHLSLGRALARLRDQNIAIIGSGFASFHNLRIMFSPQTLASPAFKARNKAWNQALDDAVLEADGEERGKKLQGWRGWEGAYDSHPRGGAEHFMPLVVCAAAGGEGKARVWKDEFTGLSIASYCWE